MKNLIIVLLVIFTISCGTRGNDYETQYSQDGKDSVVRIHYVDDRGTSRDFFMDYLLFNSLYSRGGYGSVYNYYNTNPNYFRDRSYDRYRSYSYQYSPVYRSRNYSINGNSPSRRNAGGWLNTRINSNRPSNRYVSPINGSSPSRSNSGFSFGSSSRSSIRSSSPSRNNSSPSRTYNSSSSSSRNSSPSRSSSPSRR